MSFQYDAGLNKKVAKLLSKMTLKEKVSLLSGKDLYATVPIPRLGVSPLIVTDGPHGVRAFYLDYNGQTTGRKSGQATLFPTGFSMAATWNPQLVGKASSAMAEETRALGCDILLGPCINIVRVPGWGRNFESMAEDPFLAGRVGVEWVKSLQAKGVGASVKHYACNNQELNRFKVDVRIDERTMREIYLPHFEAVVKEANPATVMCSYNRVNGYYSSQNHFLLTQVLKEEWGFQGLVISDWGANHATVESMEHGLDLEMPGPAKYYGNLLEEAVENWQIEVEKIDEAARRVLKVILALERNRRGKWKANTTSHQAIGRKVADEAVILLKNERQILPLEPKKLNSLAVIGPNADDCVCGGGSSWVCSPYRKTLLGALKKKLPRSLKIVQKTGCPNSEEPSMPISCFKPEKASGPSTVGLTARFYSSLGFKGKPVETRVDRLVDYWGSPVDDIGLVYSSRYTGTLTVPEEGWYTFKLTGRGSLGLWVDGKRLISCSIPDPKKNDNSERAGQVVLRLQEGRGYRVRIEHQHTPGDVIHSLTFGVSLSSKTGYDQEIQHAVEAAAGCDIAVVCVGLREGYESEGRDRENIKLMGEQDRLVSAVADANPRTIVVVNAGAPVEMPWADEVQAIVWAGYAGQDMGDAVADILLGLVNPSGKLPITLPKKLEDNPSYGNYPGTRRVVYGEGVFVGYRWYDAKKVEPLFCFGHGLSYTTFEYSGLKLPRTVKIGRDGLAQAAVVSMSVKNTGSKAGAETVQVYVGDPAASVSRPVRELKGFTKVYLKPGQSRRLSFKLDHRALAFFHPEKKRWTVEPGEFVVEAGASSRDIRLKGSFKAL